MRVNCRNAFTLVEVLLVVVIMAILAATVVPQFTESSADAADSALKFNLHTLRAQIELFKMQHPGVVPTITAGDLQELTLATDKTGATGAAGSSYPLGPYLVNGMPANPLTGVTTVTASATWPPASASGTGGWLYHATTGRIGPDSTGYLDW